MAKVAPFVLPRPVDANQVGHLVEKCIQDEYRREQNRRKRTVDDEFREGVSTNLPTGEFSLSNVSMHEPWQQTYFHKYGGQALPLNQNYRCRHCGCEYGCGYPPEICNVCHQPTEFGQMVKDGIFKK